MNIRENNEEEEIDVRAIAQLTEEELTEFVGVQNDEVAIKLVMDAVTKTCHGMAREIVDRRNEFWMKLLTKHRLPAKGQYMIDTRTGSVMVSV